MNIRFKITLLFTLLVTGILSLISYSVYYFTDLSRQEIFQLRLKAGAGNRANLFSILGENTISTMQKIDSSSMSSIPKRAIVIYNGDGQLVYSFYGSGVRPLVVNKQLLSAIETKKNIFYSVGDLNVSAVYYTSGNRRSIVFYAGNDEDGKGRIKELKQILLVSLLAGVIITLMVGYVFSSQLVRPIKRIIKEVNEISFNNLSDRIYRGKGQDELSGLASTFNNLLNRLQESIGIQRRFISNASHELSTPLTSISSQLQVTLQKERSSEEYKLVLQSLQEDVEQMRQLTKSLLEIAKTGYEGGIELSEVRIDEIILKIVADVKKINPAYEVEVEFGEFPDDDKLCVAYGNPDLLYSALQNITENGCKYSPDKHVHISLHFNKKQIIVQIKNYGEIISSKEMENIFLPFYRGVSASDTKGFGLGLALSKRIISLHKGEIKVHSSVKTGTLFTIIFPSLSIY
jgi:two-component system, OmpR family, sensor histidine kinase ArlS